MNFEDPPHSYDLLRLLTDDFRSKDTWADLAATASRVMYSYVAAQREALTISMEPEVLARELKITHSMMEGLNHRSSIFTDEDYDRLLSFIGLYHPDSGTEDFLKFMSFLKNVEIKGFPLWTTDYITFALGQPVDGQTIWDDPPGPWYPTTHVGLAYDSAKWPLDETDLARLFYRLAPFTLVLKWIGTIITGYMDIYYYHASYSYTEFKGTWDQSLYDILYLFPAALPHSFTYGNNQGQPYFFIEELEALQGFESGWHGLMTYPKFAWDSMITAVIPGWSFARNTAASKWLQGGRILWLQANEPRIDDIDPVTGLQGWLFEPRRHNMFKQSNKFNMYPWVYPASITTTQTNVVAPDGSISWNINDTSNSVLGTLRQDFDIGFTATYWTGYIIVKEGTSRIIGLDVNFGQNVQLVIDLMLKTSLLVSDGGGSHVAHGMVDLWNGWKLCWVICTSRPADRVGHLTLYPAWNTTLNATANPATTGSVSLFHTQAENGYGPTSPIRSFAANGTRATESLTIQGLPDYLKGTNGGIIHFGFHPAYPSPDTEQYWLEAKSFANLFWFGLNKENKVQSSIKTPAGTLDHIASYTQVADYAPILETTAWRKLDNNVQLWDMETIRQESTFVWPTVFEGAIIGCDSQGNHAVNGRFTDMWFLDKSLSDADISDILPNQRSDWDDGHSHWDNFESKWDTASAPDVMWNPTTSSWTTI